MDGTREEARITPDGRIYLAPAQYPDPGFAEHDRHAELVRRIDALEKAVRASAAFSLALERAVRELMEPERKPE